MKIELVVDDKVRIPVSYEMLESVVDRFPMTAANAQQLEALGDFPNAGVLTSLAGKEKITEALFSKLLATGQQRVIQALLDNSDAARYFDTETLTGLVAQSDFARSIASSVERFDTNDNFLVALANHPDPYVREGLAGNYSAPKQVVKMLTKDTDPAVARSAANTLA